jgi:outer membrane protein insertion porin family
MTSGRFWATACVVIISSFAAFPTKADPGPVDESGVSWAYGMIVDSVTVSGNEVTKDYVILREMETQPGEVLDRATLRRDIRYLGDMTPLSSVEVRAEPLGPNRCALRIRVRERSRILTNAVLPQFKYDFERGLTYGVRWNNMNFRGRLEQLTLSYSRTEHNDDTVGFSWWAPWLGWTHVSVGTGVSYFSLGDVPNEVSLLEQVGFYGFVGIPLTESRITFSQIYTRLDVNKSRIGGPASVDDNEVTDGKELSLSPLLGYRFDSRDSPLRPTNGGTVGAAVRATYPVDDGRDGYYMFSNDLRYFVGLNENSVLAFLSNLDYQFGDFPGYSYLTLGGAGSLRGQPVGRFKGYHRWFQTVEWRYLFLPRVVFSPPIIHEFDMALGLVTFADTGIVWNGSDDFDLENFHGTGGVGLRFYSPVQDVIRLDFGFDLHGNYRFHTATGIRF